MAKKAFEGVKRTDAYRFDPADLILIDDPEHPLYDERVHLPTEESMVRNIAMLGVIEPVVISKIGGKAIVVDGRQRVKAAREASDRLEQEGRERILVPCVVRPGNAEGLFGVAVSANEHRKDDTPLGRASKMLKLLEHGRTEQECADIFGVTLKTISNWMKLVELPNDVQDAVDRGQLSSSAAAGLSGLEPKECKSALTKLLSQPTKRTQDGKKKKKVSASQVMATTGRSAYKFRSKADALEAAPQKYREEIAPMLAGSPAARVARLASELGKHPDMRTHPAWVALKAMVGGE